MQLLIEEELSLRGQKRDNSQHSEPILLLDQM